MKCRPEEMVLFRLNYGDLIRPPFRILPSRGWGQCTNKTNDCLIVYGPKHEEEKSIFDTSPYVLKPGETTPDHWDCDGFLVPSDRVIRRRRNSRHGPLAIKFWNFRRFAVWNTDPGAYACSWSNGVFEPSEINWAIPNFTYEEICRRLEIA